MLRAHHVTSCSARSSTQPGLLRGTLSALNMMARNILRSPSCGQVEYTEKANSNRDKYGRPFREWPAYRNGRPNHRGRVSLLAVYMFAGAQIMLHNNRFLECGYLLSPQAETHQPIIASSIRAFGNAVAVA